MRRSDALRRMMRFARVIVEDGDVSDGEANAFRTWIESTPDLIGIPQVDEILGILHNVLDDGHITDAERALLAEALESFGA